MVHCGHVRLYVQRLVQSLSKLGHEPGISVRDNFLGDTKSWVEVAQV
jgi:hypothetical protein